MFDKSKEKFDEILKQLEEEQKLRKDIVAPLRSLEMNEDFSFNSSDTGRVEFSDLAFGQLCQSITNYAIPADYIKRLYKENPAVATELINTHLRSGVVDRTRKFRMKGEEVIGVVSENYIPYDNLDALTLFMETAKELPEYELVKGHVDDRIMFLRFAFPDTGKSFGRATDGQDDKNFVAIDLVNSEVGFTSIIANPSVYRLICTNGLVEKKAEFGGFKQRHIHFDPADVNLKFRNTVKHGIEMGGEIMHKFGIARQVEVKNPYEMITGYGRGGRLSDTVLKEVRENFDKEPEHNLFGVINGFTRTARDIKNIDRRISMEKFASDIMNKELKARKVLV